jgi:hypothetical protein
MNKKELPEDTSVTTRAEDIQEDTESESHQESAAPSPKAPKFSQSQLKPLKDKALTGSITKEERFIVWSKLLNVYKTNGSKFNNKESNQKC